MEHQTFLSTFRNFSLAVLLLLSPNFFGCGWNESFETTRLALFRAALPDFIKLENYQYSLDLYAAVTTVSDRDQRLNCQEWRTKLGSAVKETDVYVLLYQTPSEDFENALQSGTLVTTFKENTFIQKLVLPKNKPFLDYIALAKRMEYHQETATKWELWTNTKTDSEISNSKNKSLDFDKLIKQSSDSFLKQRYAFLSLRTAFYNNNPRDVEELYQAYFAKDNKTILAPWALYYRALGLENKAQANYCLSQVLVTSDDKAQAAVRHFDEKWLNQTLALAQTDFEKGIIKLIPQLYNPAPSGAALQEIATLIPESPYFSFLIQREVNKLEDWIFTPKYSVFDANSYNQARLENEQKDLKYLQEVQQLVLPIQKKATGEQKNFLTVALAQLAFINNQIEAGKKYTAQIAPQANPTIQLQKNIQLSLVTLKQNDLTTPETQNALYQCFIKIEEAVAANQSLFKTMYSLYHMASVAFYEKKQIPTAGLLFMKAEYKKQNGTNYEYYASYIEAKRFYEYIGYFDRNAEPKDIDALMALAQKSNKTDFEKYISSGSISPDLNVYMDLKGTLAFRKNDLELAKETFAQMPKDYWKNTYAFADYLNEDPFFPKALQQATGTRKFNYPFSKLDFVTQLIRLQKTKSASAYLKLANAYFNVSAYGNAWMMTRYESGIGYNDYAYGDSQQKIKTYGLGNYLNLNLAKRYYQKALDASTNQEQKAVCNLMLFECDFYNGTAFMYDDQGKFVVRYQENNISKLYSLYANTRVFQKYNCPLLENFIN